MKSIFWSLVMMYDNDRYLRRKLLRGALERAAELYFEDRRQAGEPEALTVLTVRALLALLPEVP